MEKNKVRQGDVGSVLWVVLDFVNVVFIVDRFVFYMRKGG